MHEKVSCTLTTAGVLRFLYMTYIFSPYLKAKTQWNKGMYDFDSGNYVNCVLLDINLYEIKREKTIGPCTFSIILVCSFW